MKQGVKEFSVKKKKSEAPGKEWRKRIEEKGRDFHLTLPHEP